ncbi:tyrosine-type recombinase/integrase [Bacteroides sp.]
MMKDFLDFVSSLTDSLEKKHRYRTSEAYQSTSRSVLRFLHASPTLDVLFCTETLISYEDYLWRSGNSRNTISFYMRMLQSMYHQAVNACLVAPVEGLFSVVFTGNDITCKRAVSPETIAILYNSRSRLSKSLAMCCDYFMLSFYLRGIPFIDLAYLRKSDYHKTACSSGRKGVITYRRRKTGTLMTVVVEPCAAEIISHLVSYTPVFSPYLLPVIRRTDQDDRLQYNSALRLHNKRLHRISELLQLDVNLTSYVSRHSWATIARRQGVPMGEISEGLGHSSERTTRIYLDSFTDEALSEANQTVIQALLDCQTEK